jgi:glycosyltransferase involved in cell wall biosynthesis
MSRSICLLTSAYPDFPDSSRAVFIRDLAHLLSQRRWTVSVIAPRIFAGSSRCEREDAVEITRFESFLNGRLLVEYPKTPVVRLIGYMLSGILTSAAVMRKNRCELIHAHWVIPAGLIAVIIGRLYRKPVVVTAHGSDILVIPKRNHLLERLAKFVLHHADAITSVAAHVTARIQEMGIRPEKIVTFPMSVPDGEFTPDGSGFAEWDSQTVVFSNRSLYPVYDVQSLVKAAPLIIAKAPKTRICIAGKGPELHSISTLAENLGVSEHVQFLGEIPHGHMPKYLRSAAVYVSTALSDGASVSLLEAMACGAVPVVADIPANREWIRDGENGFLFPPGDPRALAEKIQLCLTQLDARKKARDMNVRIIQQRAQWNLNVNRLLVLYEKVTAQRRMQTRENA